MSDEPKQALAELLPRSPSQALQRVQGEHATAIRVQVPRELGRIEHDCLVEADLLGDMAYYAWGAGKDRVEGPSKYLAMAMARLWGNCAVDLLPVQDLPESWVFTASFIDLETGFTLQRQFRQSKSWKVYGKFDEARKEDIRFQIGQSKAVRNVILNTLPEWLVNKCLDKAKGGVRERMQASIEKHGMETIQKAAIESCEKLGVPEARVLQTFGRHAASALTLEDLVILAGNIKVIQTGQDTIDAVFPGFETQRRTDQAAAPSSGQLADELGGEVESPETPADEQAPHAEDPAKGTSGDKLFGDQTPPSTGAPPKRTARRTKA